MPKDDARIRQDSLFMELRFLEDCVLFYQRMNELPTCNECAKRRGCEYVPGWGMPVRYNCPHFEPMKEVRGDES